LLAEFGFVLFCSFVDIFVSEFQHSVHKPSEFVGHSRNRFRRSQFAAQSAEVAPNALWLRSKLQAAIRSAVAARLVT
jgi:hypothetical protein